MIEHMMHAGLPPLVLRPNPTTAKLKADQTGFEPVRPKASRFQVCPVNHSGTNPYKWELNLWPPCVQNSVVPTDLPRGYAIYIFNLPMGIRFPMELSWANNSSAMWLSVAIADFVHSSKLIVQNTISSIDCSHCVLYGPLTMWLSWAIPCGSL